jgi:hypothetical protein
MTAVCMPRNRSNPFGILLIFAILASLIVLASTHAVMNHGQAAINAQNCWNGQGQVMKQIYFEAKSGRTMQFCNQGGKWFVKIDGPDGNNITMFPRSFARCLRDVLDYGIRSGFLPLH